MIERIVKVVCFAFVASFFGVIGGVALIYFDYDLPPHDKAQSVRSAIGKLKEMGPRVEEFRRKSGRLPTNGEIACDLKPCALRSTSAISVSPESDGQFTLTYTSLGVMFTPAHTFTTTWHSRDGRTDRDGWDQPWRWYVRYCAMALPAVFVILLPWIWIAVPRVLKWRRSRTTDLAAHS